ncbi:MAG: sigma-54-dependent Fis family transcriptional regulator [Planctomycetes bacterium]|nr:sigma-54-dependent Fis family transcriptional regulator [Planctomycetota bacterium]
MNRYRALVVDDEADMLEVCHDALVRLPGLDVETERSSARAAERLRQESFDVVVADLRMPPPDGVALLRTARQLQPECLYLLMTAFPTVEAAVAAMREGAFDFVVKPFSPDALAGAVFRALERRRLTDENLLLARQVEGSHRFGEILGESQAMRRVYDLVERVASTPTDVLIVGESGTGKELVARAIHARSGRKGRFVPVDCGAIPESLLESEFFGHSAGAFTGAGASRLGLLEFADGGSFFLDEVCELAPALQAKLLRVLQERRVRREGALEEIPVDLRFIAATNRDIDLEVREHRFREDLCFRLNVVRIPVPPLREREGDLEMLVSHFVARYARESGKEVRGVDRDALEVLGRHAWPGNVRELQNCLRRAVTLTRGEVVETGDLPEAVVAGPGDAHGAAGGRGFFAERARRIQAFEREALAALLERHGGDVTRAAADSELPRGTLYRLLKKHGIEADSFRRHGRPSLPTA